ncbi:MAG: hypothetical protein WC312_00985 [Candidatus Omnitrophota bacterium]|jgi:transcriptional regulator
MEEKSLSDLSKKVDMVIKLMIAGLTADKQLTDQVKILALAGIKPKDIADILGTTPNTVSVLLSRNKRK